MPGKVLGAGQHARLEHRLDLDGNHIAHQLGIAAKRTRANHGVIGVGEHVRHGCEIDVEANVCQISRDGSPHVRRTRGVARGAHLAHIGHATNVEQPGIGDAGNKVAAFLVHR